MQVSCTPHPERQSVLTIFWDGSPWRDLHTSVFGRRPALPEHYQSLEDFAEQFDVLEYRMAKNYAIRRLSLQGMLSTALARALKERLISPQIIEKVLHECIELGFVNDKEWTASFVRSQSGKKVGPRAIAQKLAQKGVRGESLEAALEKSWGISDQKTLIIQLLKTRYAKRNLSDFKERQKVVASLVRRGFDVSIILKCLGTSEFDDY